jgi:hypothetical protein
VSARHNWAGQKGVTQGPDNKIQRLVLAHRVVLIICLLHTAIGLTCLTFNMIKLCHLFHLIRTCFFFMLTTLRKATYVMGKNSCNNSLNCSCPIVFPSLSQLVFTSIVHFPQPPPPLSPSPFRCIPFSTPWPLICLSVYLSIHLYLSTLR